MYKTKDSLRKHTKKHSSDSFECSRCTQFFKTQEDLNAHLESKHSRNHLCVSCGKSYMTKSTLSVHVERKHPHMEGTRRHALVCPYDTCCKTFYQKTKYQDHLNVHSGATPYSCTECSRKFHDRYAKTAHENVCAKTSPWTCEICKIDFSQKCALNRHVDSQHIGKRVSCVCGQTFAYHSSLHRHMKNKKH